MKPALSWMHTGFTVIDSTTKTKMGAADVLLPAWTRMIPAMRPTLTQDTVTTGEPVLGIAAIESGDVPILPFEVLPAPTGAGLGSSISTFQSKPEEYVMNVKCLGGEAISCYMTGGYNHTTEPYGGISLAIANEEWVKMFARGLRQRHAKIGTVTSTGTTASSDVAGTRYAFSGGDHIVELIGVAVHGTVATGDGMAGYVKYTSNEFEQSVTDVKLPLNPVNGALIGAGYIMGTTYVDGVSRVPVDIPVGRGQVNIQDYAYFGIIPAAAGRFVDGVIYE